MSSSPSSLKKKIVLFFVIYRFGLYLRREFFRLGLYYITYNYISERKCSYKIILRIAASIKLLRYLSALMTQVKCDDKQLLRIKRIAKSADEADLDRQLLSYGRTPENYPHDGVAMVTQCRILVPGSRTKSLGDVFPWPFLDSDGFPRPAIPRPIAIIVSP